MSWVREDCDVCHGYGTVWNPYMLEDEYCNACIAAEERRLRWELRMWRTVTMVLIGVVIGMVLINLGLMP